MPTLQEQLQAAVVQTTTDSGLLHTIVHGDTNTTVTTEGGPVKSIAKVIGENQTELANSIALVTTKRDEAVAAAAAAGDAEANATTSAVNALIYRNEAVDSATAAATSEGNGETFKNAAEIAAAEALESKNDALTQAGIATTKAGEALASAGTATAQAGIATTQATNAANSATVAEGHANAAGSSATLSQNWAEQTTGTVDGSGYSAKYWAQQAGVGVTIGNFPTAGFTGDGTTTVFTLLRDPGIASRVFWVEGGVIQRPGVDFTVSGTTLTRTSPPASGVPIFYVLFGQEVNVNVPADDSVGTPKLQGNAVTYAKLQDVSATQRILGRNTAGAGDPEEISLSQLLDWIGSAAQGDILFRGATGWQRLAAGTAGQVLKTQGTAANPLWGDGGTTQTLIVQDVKSSGTMAGSFTSGAWRTRDLNTVVVNEISGASLASNQIALPAGTYEVFASVPSAFVQAHQAKLFNVTDGTDTVLGMTTSSSNASGSPVATGTNSEVVGKFTITASKVFEIRHQCEVTRTGDGFGRGGSWGNNIYTFVLIKKVA